MLINDKDAIARLSSPSNLLNKLNNRGPSRTAAMGLFGVGGAKNESTFKNPFASKPDTVHTEGNTSSNSSADDSVRTDIGNTDDTVRDSERSVDLAGELAKAIAISPPAVTGEVVNGEAEPGIDDLLRDADSQIHLSAAHNEALSLVNATLKRLAFDIDTIDSRKLPAILMAAQKVVESVRKEKLELQRQGDGRSVHYHFYTPNLRKSSDFKVIEVG